MLVLGALFWQLTVIRVYQGLPKKYPTQKISNTKNVQHQFSEKKKCTARPGALFRQLTAYRFYRGLPKKYPTQKISNTSFLRRKKGTARPGALFWQLTVIGVYQGLPKKYLTLVVLDISKIQHQFSHKKKVHCSSWGALLATDCCQGLPV